MELKRGNGQRIYIDKEEWLNESQLNIETIQYLSFLGYLINTDSTMIEDDEFFFTPCLDVQINRTSKEYQDKKEKKVIDCLEKYDIQKPQTFLFPESSFPVTIPELPFVFKNEKENGGIEKYLIETKEQLNLLEKFYNEINAYDRKRRMEELKQISFFIKALKFNKKIKEEKFLDYKKLFHEKIVLQDYIQTPTKYNTSLRVVTSSSGDILCASLKYADDNIKTSPKTGQFDIYLDNPSSPYYLKSNNIISNTVSGGNSILLGKKDYTNVERKILSSHGINPDNPVLPENLFEASITLAVNLKREIGSICGIDFIYDEKENKWKYLEEHEYPMLYSYAEKYGLNYNFNSHNFYEQHNLVDVQARLHSLSLFMKKKN